MAPERAGRMGVRASGVMTIWGQISAILLMTQVEVSLTEMIGSRTSSMMKGNACKEKVRGGGSRRRWSWVPGRRGA